MIRPWIRRCGAAYLALFFVAVAAASHHHINGLEDFLLDQPSDSGVVVESGSRVGTSGAPAWNTFRIVEDDACPACFNGDFVAAPSPPVSVFFGLTVSRSCSPEASLLGPALLPTDGSSRAPPTLS